MSTTAILVNRVDELVPGMTTAMLIEAAVRRGHAVAVCGVADLGLTVDDRVVARAVLAPRAAPPRGDPDARAAWLARLVATAAESVALDGFQRLLVRTNPARDPERALAHQAALGLAARLAAGGVDVVNRPEGLAKASSKLYLAHLPAAYRPPTVVSHDAGTLRTFVAGRAEPTILKPLVGTRGRGVFLVRPGDPNLNVIIDALLDRGHVMAQAYAAGAEMGDVRVWIAGGRPLEVASPGGPATAAIRRVPRDSDFRSNLHAGGVAEPVAIDAGQRAAIAAIGPRLATDGIILAGADLIGDQVIELNVFSPGGLRDAERFYGVDFCDAVLQSIEA